MLALFLNKNTLEICKFNHTYFFLLIIQSTFIFVRPQRKIVISVLAWDLDLKLMKFSSLCQQKEPFDKLIIWVITILCDLPTMLHTSYLIPIAQGQLNTLHLSLLWFNFWAVRILSGRRNCLNFKIRLPCC